MSKQIFIGKYYKIAHNYERLKKGKIYELVQSENRACPSAPSTAMVEDSYEFWFRDVETDKVIKVFDPPSSIIEKEVRIPKKESLKRKRQEQKNAKETLRLVLPKDWNETISLSFSNGIVLLHYSSNRTDSKPRDSYERTACYKISEESLNSIKKIVWEYPPNF